MSYYVIIRGPLGSGKSTVAHRVAQALSAEYVSIDRILDDHHLERWYRGYISQRSFLRANRFAEGQAKRSLAHGRPVVFDGNFYYRSQIEDLLGRLKHPSYVFTLKAPLEVCVERDSRRKPPHGRGAAEEVYAKSTEFEWGIGVDATQPLHRVVSDILARIDEK